MRSFLDNLMDEEVFCSMETKRSSTLMRQSAKSRDWQCFPLMTAGDRSEARMLARSADMEPYEQLKREVKPSGEWLPRPGS